MANTSRLLDQLRDTRYWVRLAAVRALAEGQDTGAEIITALLECLEGKDDVLRTAAAEALITLARRAGEIIPLLLERLSHPDVGIRWRVSWVLGRLQTPTPDLLTALVAALRDPALRDRHMAIALGRLGEPRSDVVAVLRDLVREGASPEALSGETIFDPISEYAGVALTKLGMATPELIDMMDRRASALHGIADGFAYGAYATAEKLRDSLVEAKPLQSFEESSSDYPDGTWVVDQEFTQAATPGEIDSLLNVLQSDDPRQRLKAVERLNIVDARAPDVIVRLLECIHDVDEDVRAASIQALVELEGATPSVWSAAQECLRDPSKVVFEATLEALDVLDTISLALLEAVRECVRSWGRKAHQDRHVGRQASNILVKATVVDAHPTGVSALWQPFLSHQDPWMSVVAAKILVDLGATEARSAIRTALLQGLHYIDDARDPYATIPRIAATILGKLGDTSPGVVAALLEVLPGWRCGEEAAEALGRLGVASPEVIEALFADLAPWGQGDEWWTDRATPKALTHFARAYPPIGAMLRQRLSERWADLPASLQKLLDTLSDAAYIDVLTMYFSRDGPAEFSNEWQEVNALGRSLAADPTVTAALLQYLKHPDGGLRAEAAIALGRRGEADAGVIVALVAALRDAQSKVRWAAAAALGALGVTQPEITAALLTCASDDRPVVRAAAVRALLRLASRDLEGSRMTRTALYNLHGQAAIDALLRHTPLLSFEGTDSVRPLEARTIIPYRHFKSIRSRGLRDSQHWRRRVHY